MAEFPPQFLYKWQEMRSGRPNREAMPGLPAMYAVATFFSTLVGGAFALRFSSWMDRIMAFSGGVLLAAGLLDLLPEAVALQTGGAPHGVDARTVYPPLLFAVLGFLFFYLVER